jgi:hypothetical protein
MASFSLPGRQGTRDLVLLAEENIVAGEKLLNGLSSSFEKAKVAGAQILWREVGEKAVFPGSSRRKMKLDLKVVK